MRDVDHGRDLKKTMEHESDGDTNCNRCTSNIPQTLGIVAGRFGNQRTSGYYPDNRIIKMGQNTETSLGD